MTERIIRPYAVKALSVPIIGAVFFTAVIAVTSGSEWFREMGFFIGLSAALAAVAAPFLLTRITLSTNGDITISYIGLPRHRFNTRDVVSMESGSFDTYPRLLWLFSFTGTSITYRSGAKGTRKAVLTHSLYRTSDVKYLLAFLAEHGAPDLPHTHTSPV